MKMTRIVPMMPVKSLAASVEFYQILGFTIGTRNDDWGWAMLCFDDCRLMLDRSINQHRSKATIAVPRWPADSPCTRASTSNAASDRGSNDCAVT